MTWRHRKRLATYFLLGLALIQCVSCLPELIRIAGLFGEDEDVNIENAFKYAVYRVKHERGLLDETELVSETERLPIINGFRASKIVCYQVGLNTAALFGPRSASIAAYVNSMCSALHIPHIEMRVDAISSPTTSFSINLHPDISQLARACLDVVKHYGWNEMVIVYGNNEGLMKMQAILRGSASLTDMNIIVRQTDSDNMRSVLKSGKYRGWSKFIIALNVTDTSSFLKMALQEGMVDSNHQYILTTLDMESIDMEDYRHNFVNLTGFRLIDPSDPYTRQIMEDMEIYEIQTNLRILNRTGYLSLPFESALIFDAVFMLAKALEELDTGITLRPVNVSCEENIPWSSGANLYSYLKMVQHTGLTGDIQLQQGRRLEFKLDIMQLKDNGLEKAGTWTVADGSNFSAAMYLPPPGYVNRTMTVTTLLKERIIVTTLLQEPYVSLRKDEKGNAIGEGNDRFEGFCIDLLNEVARIVGFEYKIELVPDGKFGAINDKKEWNGLVKQLIDRKADLAVAALTISYLREKYIDFTKPFLNLGISILIKVPKREKPGLFSFLNPLAIEIWIYVIGAYLVVSFMMFILARFSPYEWYNPHPCNSDEDTVENSFSLSNSFWFTVGTLMQQGSDINPRAISTRIIGGTWWFFTLIIISSYTANLAAFLTVERMVSPIQSADDLTKQTEIAYGTLAEGSTMTFFKNSSIETYQRIWKYMESNPTVFTKTSEHGIQRAKKGKYAFFMESTTIDYETQRHCDLMSVGGLLDSKGYGIGTPMGSHLRDKLSMAILHLQEMGDVQIMYNKWWKNSGRCHNDDAKKESKALGVENVGGIFVVLLGGLCLAIVVALMEFVYKSKKNAKEDRQPLCSEMAEEIRFAVRCHGSTRKPRLRRHCSKCRSNKGHTSQCPLTESALESPNGGIIQIKDKTKTPKSAGTSSRRTFETEYRAEFGEGGYLHVDYSDTET